MLELNTTTTFKKDLKRCTKRGYNIDLLTAVVDTLRIPAALPRENKDHPLSGHYMKHRECHILPDWLLIYRVEGNQLYLDRTGTHADLFNE